LDLPASSLAVLAARIEGWVAGPQLAALSLRGHHDAAAFVAGFSGSNRYVLDYLAQEVLARQPDQVREFLLVTSVLERLCGPLCDAVTGRADGQVMLEQVERANLFLIPLDEVRGWWRYHQLFADLLRARLGQEPRNRVPQLHHDAAAWHEDHRLIGEAVQHALAAGDAQWAAQLVERLYRRSEIATQQRWFAALPPIWSAHGQGCAWLWPRGRTSPAGWRMSDRCSTMRNGRWPAPRSRSSRRWAES